MTLSSGLDSIYTKYNQIYRTKKREFGNWIYNEILHPPQPPSARLKPGGGDYGHSYQYEEIFCKESKDIEACLAILGEPSNQVLDLAGGAGRFSQIAAQNGHHVTLVDKSQSMLSVALAKRDKLSPSAKKRLQISLEDVTTMDLGRRFQTIFSLRYGLDCLAEPTDVVLALKNMANHLSPGGTAFIQVHHQPYWQASPGWKKGEWIYCCDLMISGKKHKLWERTRPQKEDRVKMEHAVSRNLVTFTHVGSLMHFFPMSFWEDKIEEAGLQIYNVWGDWQKTPVRDSLPDLVFELRHSKS